MQFIRGVSLERCLRYVYKFHFVTFMTQVSVLVQGNFTLVCHNLKAYVATLCALWSASQCVTIRLGETRCYKGICICTQESNLPFTELVLDTSSFTEYNNETYPAWVTQVSPLTEPIPSWFLPVTCLTVLIALSLITCCLVTCRRYMGYKKLKGAGVDSSPGGCASAVGSEPSPKQCASMVFPSQPKVLPMQLTMK